jgi:tRNA pseudouridine32 synthase/23S rRNA pseudouridine746 synthase
MKIYKSHVKKFFSQETSLGEFLMKLTPFTPKELGDVAHKGGVWIQRRGKGKILRARVLNGSVHPEDIIQVFYDPKVLKLPELKNLEPIYESQHYGVWIKPAGVVPQGSQTSDHASLLRYVEKFKKQEVYLVHRLDRETTGLMIIAYHSKAAALLSDLFQKNQIQKEYQAIVRGELAAGLKETIKASLDDKEAITHFEVIDSSKGESLLQVTIETGRLHQIRRHLDFIGCPIMGDPKYGKGNKNRDGLKLIASKLSFEDPWLDKLIVFTLPTEWGLKVSIK